MTTMTEKSSKKDGFFSEGHFFSVLQRYNATTVLNLLQEIAQHGKAKFDWDLLVKKTTTGISNVREYQMLWRHLAYGHPLIDDLENETQPLDDDSDLEYEMKASPEVSAEDAAEAAACVKVLIASGLPRDSGLADSSTVEAPLTISIPNGQSHRASTEVAQPSGFITGLNITIPVSVQKQPMPGESDLLGTGSRCSKKARKQWSKEEDDELIEIVKKWGEGNWAQIVKEDVNFDRTPAQLSQRWSTMKKRKGTASKSASGTASQLSDAMKAARHALDLPEKSANTPGTSLNSCAYRFGPSATLREPSTVGSGSSRVQNQTQQTTAQTKTSVALKPQPTLSRTMPKLNLGSDSVHATAVAVGARIIDPSDADSLIKAAKANNTVHIMSSAGSSSIHQKPSNLVTTVCKFPAALASASRPLVSAKGSTLAVAPPATSTSEVTPPATFTSAVAPPATSTSAVIPRAKSTSVVAPPLPSTSAVIPRTKSTSVAAPPLPSRSAVTPPAKSTSAVAQPITSSAAVTPLGRFTSAVAVNKVKTDSPNPQKKLKTGEALDTKMA